MGTDPAPLEHVRIVLPDDTIQRVRITDDTTALDLIQSLTTHRVIRDTVNTLSYELVFVRRVLILEDKDRLIDVDVRNSDLLEWREVQDHGPRSYDLQGGDPETSSSDDETTPVIHTIQETVKGSKLRRPRPATSSTLEPNDILHRQKFLLQASFEGLDRLASVQGLSRQLLVQVRDIYSRFGPQPIDKLFPVVHALVCETSELMSRSPESVSENTIQSVRWVYPLLARSVYGTELPIVMEGYVDVAEWVALWRNQRRVYACLCHGAELLFFTNKKQCQEFLFERTIRGHDTASLEATELLDHKRILKDHAPQTIIDLVANKWNVRKGEVAADTSPDRTRHAFAFFDQHGKLRLILDVTTGCDADRWIETIRNELHHSQRMRPPESVTFTSPSLQVCAENMSLPLRWLHSHVDTQTRGRTRVHRAKSWTLTQALKDLRRDRLCINGIVYAGLGMEEIVGALTTAISQLESTLSPSEVLQFTRLLLVTSARTHGGGDILDAMHLAVGAVDGTAPYYFCPVDAACNEPIRIDIALEHTDEVTNILVARISMEMAYRVLPNTAVDEPLTFASHVPDTTPLILRGTYQRQLACRGEDWNRLDGSVTIRVETRDTEETR